MFKVALIGCGNIARIHADALLALDTVEVVAVVDRDPQRARNIAALLPNAVVHTELDALLASTTLDAVHVLTPPPTHAPIALKAIAANCHVLVEKPMALSTREADQMIAAAAERGVTLSICHNYLFKPSVARALALVQSGAIGRVIGMHNFYGVSPEESSLATGAGSHWAWRLKGGAFTNFLPHLMYLQEAFLGKVEEVKGVTLRSAPHDARQHAELTAVTGNEHATGTLTVSSQTAPYMKFVEIYGTRGTVKADLVREICVYQPARPVPGMVAKVLFNVDLVRQVSVGTLVSTANVLTGRWKSLPGLRELIRRFYAALEAGTAPPVTGEDGRAAVALMERLWDVAPELLEPTSGLLDTVRDAPMTSIEQRLQSSGQVPRKVLVTGATGYLGRRLVSALARCGADVVALVRDRSRVAFELEEAADVVECDLHDVERLYAVMKDVDLVYHCAAVTSNKAPWALHEHTNVLGTRSVCAAAAKSGVQRLVHVSSVIVYGVQSSNGTTVDETTALSTGEDPWAYYERSKIGAEQEARRAQNELGLSVTIVRPGIIYGPGRPVKSGLVRLGATWVSMGSSRNRLPLTYIDNTVDALLLAGTEAAAANETYNIVDEHVTRQGVLREEEGEKGRILPVPAAALHAVAAALERRQESEGANTPPKLSRFVLRTATRDILYETRRAREQLGWEPETPVREALARMGS